MPRKAQGTDGKGFSEIHCKIPAGFGQQDSKPKFRQI